MSHGEVMGHASVPCATCAHLNDARAEWCDACLAEVKPDRRRRKRPRRLSTRVGTPSRRDEVLT